MLNYHVRANTNQSLKLKKEFIADEDLKIKNGETF